MFLQKLFNKVDNVLYKLSRLIFPNPRPFKIISGPLKGLYIYLSPRHGFGKVLGHYEDKLSELIKLKVKSGTTCIDVGSHVGYFTLLFRKMVGTKGYVYSVDPVEENIVLIDKTVKKNGFSNIKILKLALGEVDGVKKAYHSSGHSIGMLADNVISISKGLKETKFQVKRLDTVVREENIKNLDYIKVDIEGAEYNFLLGGKDTIKKHKPVIFMEVHSKEIFKKVYKFLTDYGYRIFDINSNEIHSGEDPFEERFHIYAER